MHAALLSLLLAAEYAWVEEGPRLDHRGQPSIYLAATFEELAITGRSGASAGGLADVALGLPVTDEGGVIVIGGRVGTGEPLAGERLRLVAPYAAYRGYAGGDEPWKTFFDAGVMLRLQPAVGAGVRVGGGVQYDLGENLGAFLGAGIGLAGGEGVHLHGDVSLGVQLRFGSAG